MFMPRVNHIYESRRYVIGFIHKMQKLLENNVMCINDVSLFLYTFYCIMQTNYWFLRVDPGIRRSAFPHEREMVRKDGAKILTSSFT